MKVQNTSGTVLQRTLNRLFPIALILLSFSMQACGDLHDGENWHDGEGRVNDQSINFETQSATLISVNDDGDFSFVCTGLLLGDTLFQGNDTCLSQVNSDEGITADPLFVCLGEGNIEQCTIEEMTRIRTIDISFETNPLDHSKITQVMINLDHQ